MATSNTPQKTSTVTLQDITVSNIESAHPAVQDAIRRLKLFDQEMAALGHKPGCTVIGPDGQSYRFEGNPKDLINWERELHAQHGKKENYQSQKDQ